MRTVNGEIFNLYSSKALAPWGKKDTVIAALLGGGTILSRWPFHLNLLNNFDAVNYALAIDHFDIRLHQPQPPGYPLYILLARAFNLVFADHLSALLWLSTVFSALAVIAVYLVGRDMFSRRVGLAAAFLLMVAPVFWSRGIIAAPYTTDLFASAIVVWLCYRTFLSSDNKYLWISALTLGLVGAFRLQTMVFLFPLFLFSLHRRPWKVIAGAVVLAGGVFSVFFLPAMYVSGGPSAFSHDMRAIVPIFKSTNTLVKSTRLTRFMGNAATILRYTIVATGELLLPLVVLGYFTRPHWRRFWRNRELIFMALWVFPTWIVYLLVWPGNLGTMLVCISPFFLLAALGIEWLFQRPGRGSAAAWAALLVIFIWHSALFILLPERPFSAYRRFNNFHALVDQVEGYRHKLELLNEVPADGTIVYAQDFRHIQYYLPQYRTFTLPRLSRSNPSVVKFIVSIDNGALEGWSKVSLNSLIPVETERIVFFDLPAEDLLAEQSPVREVSSGAYSLEILDIPAGHTAQWTPDGLTIIARPATN